MSPRRAARLSLVVLLAGCSGAAPPTPHGGPAAPRGPITVTDGGTQLNDGDADVPPTLALGVEGAAVTPQVVAAGLDGRPLSFSSIPGGVTAVTAPMPFGSSHTLVVDVFGHPPQRFAFQVVGRTQVSAAAWLSPGGGLTCQVVFQIAPDPAALAAALPGASLAWIDPTHLSLTWRSPPATLTIPAGLPADRGSVLDGPLSLALTGLHPGQLRRATVPPATPAPPALALTLWTVGTAASHASAEAHAGQVAIMSPTGWRIEADGSLAGTPDAATLAAAQGAGTAVWPLVSNDFSDPTGTQAFLRDPSAEQSAIAALVGQVRSRGLAGINLDFELINGTDTIVYTNFVDQLAAALHAAGARLSVDVIPHTTTYTSDLAAAYDEPALARAADQLVVMAYDEHLGGGDPGPIAGLGWQEAELAGTMEGVPAGKVVLGLSLYAEQSSAGNLQYVGDYTDGVATALAQPGAAYNYDFEAATPELTSTPGGVLTQLWFDDADSLLRKIDLAARLSLAGIAAWRAGFEDPAFWGVL
jgi:spore germination protein YaaH